MVLDPSNSQIFILYEKSKDKNRYIYYLLVIGAVIGLCV